MDQMVMLTWEPCPPSLPLLSPLSRRSSTDPDISNATSVEMNIRSRGLPLCSIRNPIEKTTRSPAFIAIARGRFPLMPTGDFISFGIITIKPKIMIMTETTSGMCSVLESIAGRDFLLIGSGIVTRGPLVLQLYKIEEGEEEYAQFLHQDNKRIVDFGEKTIGVLTKLDLMDKGTKAREVTVNDSLFSWAQLYSILELCHAFDRIFKEHLDGRRSRGDRIGGVFGVQLPAALRRLPFDCPLSLDNARKIVSEADGYQPHLIAPEQGYRPLIDGALSFFKGPAKPSVDTVHSMLKEIVRLPLVEAQYQELRPFPTLRSETALAANESLLDHFCVQVGKKEVLDIMDVSSHNYCTKM